MGDILFLSGASLMALDVGDELRSPELVQLGDVSIAATAVAGRMGDAEILQRGRSALRSRDHVVEVNVVS
jgi:hypothetical protein